MELLQIGGKFCKEKYHERSARQSRAFVRRASVNPPLIRINVYPWTSGGTNPVHVSPSCASWREGAALNQTDPRLPRRARRSHGIIIPANLHADFEVTFTRLRPTQHTALPTDPNHPFTAIRIIDEHVPYARKPGSGEEVSIRFQLPSRPSIYTYDGLCSSGINSYACFDTRGDKSAIFHGEIEVCLGRVEFYKRGKEKEIKITGWRKVSMIGKRGYLKRTVNEIEVVSWRLNPLPR